MKVQFFSIRNWTKFQHYSKRNPPWIRLYHDLLRDRAYQKLSDTCRSHLVGLFLLASHNDNRIPDDQVWLRHELCTKTPIDLKTLVASGFIQMNSENASDMLAEAEMLAARQQLAAEQALRDRSTDNSETDNSEADTRTAFGEFGHVRLSESEVLKLKEKLNGNFGRTLDRLDRYAEQSPAKFRKYKSHYATLLNWAERDGVSSKPATIKPTEAEIQAAAAKLAAAREPKANR